MRTLIEVGSIGVKNDEGPAPPWNRPLPAGEDDVESLCDDERLPASVRALRRTHICAAAPTRIQNSRQRTPLTFGERPDLLVLGHSKRNQ